jgi:hypothetical protein
MESGRRRQENGEEHETPSREGMVANAVNQNPVAMASSRQKVKQERQSSGLGPAIA